MAKLQVAIGVIGPLAGLRVRRTRLLGPQAELWPDWRHFCFITNRDEDIARSSRPSGHFHANAAWTVLAALAHNMLRWTQLLGLPDHRSGIERAGDFERRAR